MFRRRFTEPSLCETSTEPPASISATSVKSVVSLNTPSAMRRSEQRPCTQLTSTWWPRSSSLADRLCVLLLSLEDAVQASESEGAADRRKAVVGRGGPPGGGEPGGKLPSPPKPGALATRRLL